MFYSGLLVKGVFLFIYPLRECKIISGILEKLYVTKTDTRAFYGPTFQERDDYPINDLERQPDM